MSRARILVLTIITVLVIAVIVLGIFSIVGGNNTVSDPGGTLTIWRVFDSDDSLDPIIQRYRAIHPQITFNVVKVPEENIRERFLEALARDEQPDILAVHASRIREFKDFLEPMPPETKVAELVTSRPLGLKEETTTELVTYPSPTEREISERFVRTVKEDVVIENQIYGLPLSVDSLALYYNPKLLDRAGIALPPRTYSELLSDVPKLTVRDEQGNIVQSAIALGTTNNIDRSFDILSLLMLQNGATMIDREEAAFDRTLDGRKPGLQALEFYIGFADPAKEAYTWNENLTNAREMFAQGNLAFYLGYAYELPLIRATASPGTEIAIAKAPQTSETPLHYANYWVEAVTAKSTMKQAAWNFVLFAASSSNVTEYLNKTGKPGALRNVVDQQKNDLDLGVFAEQALTATTWYDGRDIDAAENAFDEMVRSALTLSATLDEAIQLTAEKVTQTLR